jgi:hypothetical protein
MDVELHMEEGRAEDHTMHRQATIQERAQPFRVTRVATIPVAEPEQNIIITPGVIITMEIRIARITPTTTIAEARHSITGQTPGIIVTQTVHGETADLVAILADSTVVPALTQPQLCLAVVVEAVAEVVEIKNSTSTLRYGRKKIQDVPDSYCFA